MITSLEQIEQRVLLCGGTHVKRNNLRKRLRDGSNKECEKNIDRLRVLIRKLKADGAKEGDLKKYYSQIGYFQRLKL